MESSHGIEKVYVTRGGNRNAFRSTLKGKLIDDEWEAAETNQTDDLDCRVSRLTAVKRDAAEESLKRRKVRGRSVPWWIPALTRMKRAL